MEETTKCCGARTHPTATGVTAWIHEFHISPMNAIGAGFLTSTYKSDIDK